MLRAEQNASDECLWAHQHVVVGSDVMSVSLAEGAEATACSLLAGLRSGTVLRHAVGPANLSIALGSRETFPFQSRGAVTHVVPINDREFISAYTNGDLVLGDMSRFSEPPARRFAGHQNRYLQGLGIAVEDSHRLLACAGDDNRVRIWSLDECDPIAEYVEHTSSEMLQARIFPAPVLSLAWTGTAPASDDAALPRSTDAFPHLAVATAQTILTFASGSDAEPVEL